MAARRVSLGYLVSSVLLAVGAAAATFQLKYAVRDLERELAATQARIEQERWAVQAARADLEYLTRPDRLVLQAGQLGMVEARGGRLAGAAQLPDWEQLQWSQGADAGHPALGCRGRAARQAVRACWPSSAWASTDGDAPARARRRAASTPALAKGRGRLRVVGAVFALAFLSIGLRLIDMVGWQAEGPASGRGR